MVRRTRVLVLFAIALASTDARPDPARKAKPVTQADLDQLDKKIEDQQKLLKKLIVLQQQYLMSLVALLPDAASGERVAVEPPPTQEPKAEPKPEPKPVAKPHKPKPEVHGSGTVVGKITGGGGDAFVYIEDIVATSHDSARMKQEGRQFTPRVLAVQKGTRVDFPNLDAVFHNVFSISPDNSFDLGSYKQGESKSVTMTKPGVVTVYCNMHPNMVGHILVVPSSLYTRAGQDGFYRLSNIPAGHHKLVAWAPNAKPVFAEIDIADGDTSTIELDLKRGHTTPHTNKEGLPYGSYRD